MNRIPESFVFMKVGMHAHESLEEILERKAKELRSTGRIFWGYGGNTCHPTKRVQPFVRSRILEGETDIYLLMEPIRSLANPALAPAQEYSIDGRNWQPIPKGIRVTGSKYALVLDEIMPASFSMDPRDYVVGHGESAGKYANDYLRSRVDKGCFTRATGRQSAPTMRVHEIALVAKLQEPFAVHVRG